MATFKETLPTLHIDTLWALYNATPGTAENEELLIALESEIDSRETRRRTYVLEYHRESGTYRMQDRNRLS